MKNIDNLRDFLDENNIDYAEGSNHIEIYRGNIIVDISFQLFNNGTSMYYGRLEGSGISTCFYGNKLSLEYNVECEEFEIGFIKDNSNGFSKFSKFNYISISKEDDY